MFVDPTLAARPRWEVALTFYSLQRVYSSVHVSGISQPLVQLARPAGKAGQPELLEASRLAAFGMYAQHASTVGGGSRRGQLLAGQD